MDFQINNDIFLQLMSIYLIFIAAVWGVSYAIKIAKSS